MANQEIPESLRAAHDWLTSNQGIDAFRAVPTDEIAALSERVAAAAWRAGKTDVHSDDVRALLELIADAT